MKPEGLSTKIFLDSGDPAETEEVLGVLGWLDGQTTNPSLIAKNPTAAARFERGERISEAKFLDFYKDTAKKISDLIPKGSVSLEVYADDKTSAEEMFSQAEILNQWIPNAHIKYPTTTEGLKAAEKSLSLGLRVNMTLVFSQEQAAAIGIVGKDTQPGDVFISPFVGRLDDRGENGMDVIKNTIRMYRQSSNPVQVLAASVRSMDHFMYSLALGADIITAPHSILKEWAEKDLPLPGDDFAYDQKNLSEIPFQDLDLSAAWQSFNIRHALTDAGIEKFAADWNKLIER